MSLPEFRLDGGTVVVTGATGNLGGQFTRTLLASGARVAMLDVSEPDDGAVASLAADVGADIDDVLFVACDLTDDDAVRAAGERVTDTLGVPTGLVNCAAIDAVPAGAGGRNEPFETFPSDRFNQIADVNLTGVVRCCQVFGGAMARAGHGAIVNIASHYGVVAPDQRMYRHLQQRDDPFFKPAVYTATKAGVIGLTRYLAVYWATQGVRVNTLTPGGVFAGQDPSFVAEYEDRVPLGRMASADEYNGAVMFLLSEASSYMTGANLVIDGGFSSW